MGKRGIDAYLAAGAVPNRIDLIEQKSTKRQDAAPQLFISLALQVTYFERNAKQASCLARRPFRNVKEQQVFFSR
jgi:hypothetical protein